MSEVNERENRRYGLTKVPKDWEVTFIDDVATRKSGHTPNKKTLRYWNGKIPWVSLKDISRFNSHYVFQTTDYTTMEGIENSSAVLLPKGTVMISRDATIGKVAITGAEMATSQHFINYICGPKLDNVYLYYSLLYRDYIFEKFAIGSTIKTIGLNFFKNLKIVLPSKEEQQKIADILSTWDKAIELQERLIEQKQLQKKDLMQKVLTGDVRLPGFESEWEQVSLEELGQLKTSSVNKKSESEEIPVSLVNYMDVYKNGMIDETINYMQVTATKKQIETFKVNYGDVLFTPSSETPDDIGHSAVVKINKEKLLFSYHLIRLQFYKDMDINFKAYVFNSSVLLKDFARKSTGSTRYTLSLKDFKESEVKIPTDYEEQKAIGELLFNIDKEIVFIKKKTHYLKQQKNGLMQLLLTGEVRVNV